MRPAVRECCGGRRSKSELGLESLSNSILAIRPSSPGSGRTWPIEEGKPPSPEVDGYQRAGRNEPDPNKVKESSGEDDSSSPLSMDPNAMYRAVHTHLRSRAAHSTTTPRITAAEERLADHASWQKRIEGTLELLERNLREYLDKTTALEQRLHSTEVTLHEVQQHIMEDKDGDATLLEVEQLTPSQQSDESKQDAELQDHLELKSWRDEVDRQLSLLRKDRLEAEGPEATDHEADLDPEAIRVVEKGPTTDHEVDYFFHESIWDLAILIGMPYLTLHGSIWIGVLFVLNAGIQIAMCLVINDFFTNRSIGPSTIEDLQRWRISSGHDIHYVDRQSSAALVQRVCAFDESMPLTSAVQDILKSVAEYMPDPDDYEKLAPYLGHFLPPWQHVGFFMCAVSVFIWLLMVAEDFADSMGLCSSLLVLPVGGTHVRKMPDGFKWQSTTSLRKWWCYTIVALKIFVACLLAISGTLYLCFTLSLTDLLLNSAALQIVLDLDELIFQALAPVRPRHMLQSMKPLPFLPYTDTARPLLAFISIVVVLFSVALNILSPQSDILRSARHEICGGNINFIAVDDASGKLYATEVAPYDSVLHRNYHFRAMEELIRDPDQAHKGWGSDSLSGIAAGLKGGAYSLMSISEESVKEASALRNQQCVDMLSPSDSVSAWTAKVSGMIVEEYIGNTLTSCHDVKRFCNSVKPAGVRARQYCPVTCGCSEVGSSLLLTSDNSGCPHPCERTDSYKTSSSSRNCSDEVDNGTLLLNYIHGLDSYLEHAPVEWRSDVKAMIKRVGSEGCSVVTTPWNPGELSSPWEELCTESPLWLLQPLSFACPVSCRCATEKLRWCPESCQVSN